MQHTDTCIDSVHLPRQWAKGSGQWAVGGGQWAVGSGPAEIVHRHQRAPQKNTQLQGDTAASQKVLVVCC